MVFSILSRLVTLPVSSFVTRGLANMTNHEILLHGTSVDSYLGILANGGQPSENGLYGQTEEELSSCFYVVKDVKT